MFHIPGARLNLGAPLRNLSREFPAEGKRNTVVLFEPRANLLQFHFHYPLQRRGIKRIERHDHTAAQESVLKERAQPLLEFYGYDAWRRRFAGPGTRTKDDVCGGVGGHDDQGVPKIDPSSLCVL
jgi:hypothetical protein